MKGKEKWLVPPLMLLKFCLPFLLSNAVFELHRDEYLYYEQGQHLALGYLENPPLIGLLARISSLFGGNFFRVKFWPALFGAATLWLTLKMAKEAGGGFYAQLIAALGILFSAYLRIHFLFQPNFLDIFFWSLSAFFLLRWINTEQSKYIYLLAVSLVLGWYGKYAVLFFVAALLLSLLLTYHRRIFLRRQFWMALLMGLVFILPNLFWQYFHHWPLVHHMKELQKTQLQHLNRLDFLKEQLLMLMPVTFVWIGGLVWLLKNRTYRVIGYCYLLVVALLMTGSGKGYYALGAYPVLLAAGGVWAEKISVKRTWLRYAFAFLILALSLPFVPLLLPVGNPQTMAVANKKRGWGKLGILTWEDGKDHLLQQDFADMLGWKELARKTGTFFRQQPDSDKAATVIYCRNYGLAGGVKYYAADDDLKAKVISDNGSFLLWISNSIRFKNVILIGGQMPGKDDEVFRHFKKAAVVDSCTDIYSRQYGTKIIYFHKASDSAWLLAQKGLQEKKAEFGE